MADGYDRHQWQDGELITTSKLNALENSIGDLYDNQITQDAVDDAVSAALTNVSADVIQAVSYNRSQTLGDTEKRTARENIGAASNTVVSYNESQALSDAQKEIARTNIGAASQADLEEYNISDVTRIRINKNSNNSDSDYPLLVSNSDDPWSGSNVEGQLNNTNEKNPTVNYSTGVLKAMAFSGDGSRLTNLNGAEITNGISITDLSASNITNGILDVTHGGTGSGTALQARKNLGVLSATDIAPAFSSEMTYRKNNYCVYDNRIRRCIADSSTGTWDQTSNNWEPVVFSSIIASIEDKANTQVNVMGAATSSTNGTAGQVPAPSAGDNTKFLSGDATWKEVVTDINREGNLLTVAHGGTGSTTSAGALENLGWRALGRDNG